MKKLEEELVRTSMSLDKSAVENLEKLSKQFGLNNKSRVLSIILKGVDEEFFVKCFSSQVKS